MTILQSELPSPVVSSSGQRSLAIGTMRQENVPTSGVSYWLALCLASILGCNTGDLFASFFGFTNGLPILIAAFAAILVVERRTSRPTQAWYWLGVIVVRTAATNLADFAGHELGFVMALSGLSALLIGALALRHTQPGGLLRRTSGGALANVDALYWATMLIAGTIGTAIGDFSSFQLGLGLAGASLALTAIVAGLVIVATARQSVSPLFYWLTVVTIRAAGTAGGDFFARQIGLWQSTVIFAIGLAAFLALAPRKSLAEGSAERLAQR